MQDPRYAGWIGGRVEVWGDGPYAEREIRFFTDKRDEFGALRDKWDLEEVTDEQLAHVERQIAERFTAHDKREEDAHD